ncbi:MAG TPA: DUF4321 domain-containing protein [Lachnospiraceae bacterium]|nr:DUF4321 domain-containing protein [Lachnospiraceae bacterium]
MARTYGKNNWALFLLILTGLVAGSFLGQLAKDVSFLSWLNFGIDFAIGDTKSGNIISLDLGVLVIQFGIRLKITIASVIGALCAILIYKKI